ncbi:MAG: ATP-binding cassette domain-containing protein [Alphaproteobacteria bacterium]|nr:ATP-binding cassette domain-containing protein [Alphaproteobacteria bacterium]
MIDATSPLSTEILLEADSVCVHFQAASRFGLTRPPPVRAVDGVSLRLVAGDSLAVVGESGCGKSTLARALAALIAPTAGQVRYRRRDVATSGCHERRLMRRAVQMVFQNPSGALDPRLRVETIVREGLDAGAIGMRAERVARVAHALDMVGLGAQHARAYPGQLSGGQQQRVGIARAIVMAPEVLICDEVTSALDVSIKVQIVELLMSLRDSLGLAYLFISHDLGIVRQIATRVAVMYLGQIVETASTASFYRAPAHPYSVALLSAVPIPDPAIEATRHHIELLGEVPSPSNMPTGCRFRTRCAQAQPRCAAEAPELRDFGPGRAVACHYPISASAD